MMREPIINTSDKAGGRVAAWWRFSKRSAWKYAGLHDTREAAIAAARYAAARDGE